MKKLTKDLSGKTVVELQKEVSVLKADVAKLMSTRRAKPEKDTNMVVKKQKRIAVALTLISQKNSEVKK